MDTFEKIKDLAMNLGNVKINSVKNAILFTSKSHFLAVKPKKAWIDIEFVLDVKIEGFPIHKTVQTTKTKWAHFIRLQTVEEIDDQLINWLKKAYEICSY